MLNVECLLFSVTSLPFVFAFAEALIDLEARLLGVGDGERLEFVRRTEIGKDLAHRLLARRTIRERLGRERPVQREFPAADLAVAFAQFVFVMWHNLVKILLGIAICQILNSDTASAASKQNICRRSAVINVGLETGLVNYRFHYFAIVRGK